MQNEGSEADRLMRVVERIVRVLRAHSATEPLSFAAGSALNTLEAIGPQAITPLARVQGVSQPAMTQLVDRLASDGLVERRPQDDDRRSVLVALTPAGKQTVAARRARRTARFESDLDVLTAGDRAAIVGALPALEILAEVMVDALVEGRAAGPTTERMAAAGTSRGTESTKQ